MKILVIVACIIVISCSYTVYPSGYPHLKTITVTAFENRTTQYNLDEDLLNALSSQFIQDGRLKLVTLSPDCRLEGKILDYSNKIYKYSDEAVEQYEVKIFFALEFTDLVKNTLILNKESIILSETYSETDPNSEFQNESEAQQKIFEDLFDLIIKDTLEAW